MKKKIHLAIFLSFAVTGCSTIPHRKIIVTDESGNPIRGAKVTAPYPMVWRDAILPDDSPSSNSSNSRGHLILYDMTPGRPYTLVAKGYEAREISFPENNRQTFALRRQREIYQIEENGYNLTFKDGVLISTEKTTHSFSQ